MQNPEMLQKLSAAKSPQEAFEVVQPLLGDMTLEEFLAAAATLAAAFAVWSAMASLATPLVAAAALAAPLATVFATVCVAFFPSGAPVLTAFAAAAADAAVAIGIGK